MSNLTPLGVYDLLPESASIRKSLIEKFSALAEQAGFRYIETPAIEYYSALSKGLSESQKKNLLKFIDGNGNTLIMRPDLTTPMARMVASQMKSDPLPLRLYLKNTIFSNPQTSHHETERFQCGLEVLGDSNVTADAEVIQLAAKTLETLGVDEFQIDVGHIGLIDNLSEKDKAALLSGNYIELGYIPERGNSDVISDNQELVALSKELPSSLEVSFNRGLIKALDYYTGVIFQISVPGIGKPVASGGRYDKMIGRFGYDVPACGFGLDLGLIQAYLDGKK